jgi:glycosyltransferase involved in cell wall biosynthesis
MNPPARQRLLIFVIAYYAESTLRWVLERIPASIFDQYECEILVVDDASGDRTFAIGVEYKDQHPGIRMTVLRNEFNRGYGGNQKIGYAYAVAERFDFVAMVHGDGQYAPEELPRLMEPLREGNADAVFGSRMMERFAALKGGMPLYKYVGNRILTKAQNALVRVRLSEFHSGYRIYSVKVLQRIPFQLNSNEFHFDTEVLIQLLNAKARIVELPIPTYYGNEICRVNGIKYAKDVMIATLRNVAHRSGLIYQRRYDPLTTDNSHYGLKLGYPSSHSWALDAVPTGAAVIDVGSGPGGFARELVNKGCMAAIVDRVPPAEALPNVEVFVQDLDEPLQFHVGKYQYILLLDVIEHLREPERFLERLRLQFDYSTKTVILTTPNIAFVVQRLMLLAGQFNYGKAGILDRTHTRLFTFRGVRHLLRDTGFRITKMRGIPAPFPKVLGNGRLARAAIGVNLALIRVSRALFSYQIYVEAEGTPSVDFLLRDAKEKSAARAASLSAEAAGVEPGGEQVGAESARVAGKSGVWRP